MDAQYVASLEATLIQTLDPATVKQATSKLSSKELYKNPSALPSLLHLLQNTQQDAIRQLAAVEARKLVVEHWETIDPLVQAEIRSSLLTSTFQQQSKAVRHASAQVVAAIADEDLTKDAWPQLLPDLVAAVQGENTSHQETALDVLLALFGTFSPGLAPHQDAFVDLFAGLVAHEGAPLSVRVQAAQGLDCLGQSLEESGDNASASSVVRFTAAIPNVVTILAAAVAANSADDVREVFGVVNGFLFLENKLMGEHLVPLIEQIATIAAETSADEEVRSMAMQFLVSAVQYRKTKVSGAGLGPALTKIACTIACEPVDVEEELDNEDEENENEENTPAALALRLLSSLAGELPPSQVVAPFLESHMTSMITSTDVFARRAGFLVIGTISSGAPDYLATHVARVVPALVQGLQDPEALVKVASVKSLSELASELQDSISDYHEQLLPLIIAMIDSATHVMAYKYACHALDGIIEFMSHDAVKQYMEPLMHKLFDMLRNAQSASLKTAVISAIGSTAFAGGKGFKPFFDDAIRVLEPYVAQAANTEGLSQDEVELRAVTFENISTMARAVGSEPFAAYAKPLVEAAYGSIGAENSRIRESGFAFISNMAKVYGPEFAGFLPELVPQILKCLEQEEFSFEGLEDEDEEELGEDAEDNFKFNSGITIEKEIASVALAVLASGTGVAFAPYVESSLKTLAEQAQTSYGMRAAAVTAAWKIVRAMFTATYGADFKAPKGVPQQSYVDPNVLQLLEQARAITMENLVDEFEFNVVVGNLDNITESLQTCGIAALISNGADTSVLEQLCVEVMKVLKKEHACQVDEEELVDEGEDTSEAEAMLFESALEVLIMLSSELGPDFIKIFESFKDVILSGVTSKSKSKRVASIGGLAEIAVGLKDSNPYTAELLQVFSDRLANDKSLEVKGNAAYGVGILVENSSTDYSAGFSDLLQTMFHLLARADEQASLPDGESKEVVNRCTSNACGCVARMALKNSAAVPVEHVLPALLQHLPLESGVEENVPILTWIVQLYESGNAAIESQTERVIEILAQVFQKEADRLKLAEESTLGREETLEKSRQFHTIEVQEKVVSLLKFLNGKYASLFSGHEVLKSVVA